MELTEEHLAFVREHCELPPKKIAKHLKTSVRRVERALEALGMVEAARRSRRARWARRVAGGAAIALLAIGGVRAWRSRAREHEARVEAERARDARLAESRIYDAIDRHERGREQEFLPQLESPSETTRLAAVRYLLTSSDPEVVARALGALEDKEERIRVATIQRAGEVYAPLVRPSIEERLATIAASPARSLVERRVALLTLARRPGLDVQPHFKALLSVLTDASVAIREAGHAALAAAFPASVPKYTADGRELERVWVAAVTHPSDDVAAVPSFSGDFRALTAALSAARPAQDGARDRAQILTAMARLRTVEARDFLIRRALDRGMDDLDRLAALNALSVVRDTAALATVAAATSDALVHAKLEALTRRH